MNVLDTMIEALHEQKAATDDSNYTLEGFSKTQLNRVESFVESFRGFVQPGGYTSDGAIRAELQSENHVLRGERDRLQRELDELRAHPLVLTPAVDAMRVNDLARDMNARIDQVVEIIGARVEGLVNDIAVATDSAKRAHEQIRANDDVRVFEVMELKRRCAWLEEQVETLNPGVSASAFPTGSASTAEAAAEAVLPVPQRGDRVRLEGARSLRNEPVADGWFDVVGHGLGGVFQISVPVAHGGHPSWLPWVAFNDPGLKEVRHAQ